MTTKTRKPPKHRHVWLARNRSDHSQAGPDSYVLCSTPLHGTSTGPLRWSTWEGGHILNIPAPFFEWLTGHKLHPGAPPRSITWPLDYPSFLDSVQIQISIPIARVTNANPLQ